MLYEQVVHDLQCALDALGRNDIEQRTRQIDHALAVVGQLHGTLNFESGGEVAVNLERYYNLLRATLFEAQIRGSGKIIQDQITNLLSLREAWIDVEKAALAGAAPALAALRATREQESSAETVASNWNA